MKKTRREQQEKPNFIYLFMYLYLRDKPADRT